jgi:hypothetical protein
MISATISPWAEALWASMGSPTRSPMAQTFFMDVRHWSSTLTKGPLMSTAIRSRPQPRVLGRLPTVPRTLSAGISNLLPVTRPSGARR